MVPTPQGVVCRAIVSGCAPISARIDEIGELIPRHQVVVLCGETGSGKSTQLRRVRA